MLPTVYRCGWPSTTHPPSKIGRFWIWVGPYMIGWNLP